MPKSSMPSASPCEGRAGAPEIDAEWFVELLKANEPDGALIQKQEAGWYIIDGHFDVASIARTLSERLRKRPA